MRLTTWLYPFLFFILFLAIWDLSIRFLGLPPYLIPPIVDVLSELNSDILPHFLTTLAEASIGFVIANILGFITAVLFVHFRPLEKGLYPFAIALKTTPLVALAPLLVVWLGTGWSSKIVAAIMICFFPMVVNGVKGLRSVDRETIELFQSYGAKSSEIFWRLRLPSSLPYVTSALKISTSLAVVGAIVGEFVGASKGLGYLVLVSSYHMNTSVMFAAIICSALAGLLMFGLVSLLERRVIFWKKVEE